MPQKQGQKLLAALNLPQVGSITLLPEDASGTLRGPAAARASPRADDRSLSVAVAAVEGPGLFTIELNERVYTIKARSHEEAAFWVDVRRLCPSFNPPARHNLTAMTVQALLWRQAGGVVTQKSPDVSRVAGISAVSEEDLESLHRSGTNSTASSSTTASVTGVATKRVDAKPASSAAPPEEDVKNGACAACCTIQ